MKKLLFMRPPLISTYTSYGALFSISNDNILPWAFNNFIQIRYNHSSKLFVFDNHYLLLNNCEGISYFEIPQEIVSLKWNSSIKKLIIDSINMGLYLYIYIDRYYLPDTEWYQKKHFYHEVLVYGFDTEKNMVYVADNLKVGKFIQTTFSFEDMEKAYSTIIEEKYQFLTNIRFLQPRPECLTKFNIHQVLSSLKNYLNSKKTIDMVVDQEISCGYDAINILIKKIEDSMEIDKGIDMRAFHLLYEHKLIMEKRVEYLMKNKYIMYDENFLNSFSKLKQDFFILRNIFLKYLLSTNKKDLKMTHQKLLEYLHLDKRLTNELIEKIESQ